MKTVMLQFQANKEQPSVESVKAQFKLPDTAIDEQFGVLETDSSQKLYVIMVDVREQARIEKLLDRKSNKHSAEGFFSNPPLDPV